MMEMDGGRRAKQCFWIDKVGIGSIAWVGR